MISIENLSYTYPGQQHPALSGISLHAEAGECICLAGHSGCGKSTLLLALRGLLSDGVLLGSIQCGETGPHATSAAQGMGLVFQNAESQILCATVYDEVAFGPENLALPSDAINQRIVAALSAVNLLHFGNRNVERFSAGQKQRLCIAAVLAMQPDVLLLDEPTSQLDQAGRQDLLAILRHLKDRGFTIVIAEHTVEPFREIIDRYYLLANGTITGCHTSLPEFCRPVGQLHQTKPTTPVKPRRSGHTIIATGLAVSYPGGAGILEDISLAIAPGERVHLYGANGCGKSTLLKVLAGAVKPDRGTVTIADTTAAQAGDQVGIVSLLLQNPQRQLFEDTVHEEVAFTLKRLRMSSEEINHRVIAALTACEALHLEDRLPLTLSFGEQHRVALASVIAPNPRVLLMDEPFAGLDPEQRLRLLQILARIAREQDTAMIIASHDPLPDPSWADRTITMTAGRQDTRGEVAP